MDEKEEDKELNKILSLSFNELKDIFSKLSVEELSDMIDLLNNDEVKENE